MAFEAIKTRLGSSECGEYFSSFLTSNQFEDTDNSIMTVYRILLNEDRMKAFEGLNKCQTIIASNKIELKDRETKITERYFTGDFGPFKIFKMGVWIDFISNRNATEYIAQTKGFDGAYLTLGWKRLEDVSLFLDSKGDVLVYQNPDKMGTIIIAPYVKRIQVMQLVASCISRIYPWCFKDYPLTEDETHILKLLAEQKYDEFKNKADEIYNNFDFYGRKLKSMLKGFCSQNFDRAITSQQDRINRTEQKINDYLKNLRDTQKELEEQQLKLLVLRNKVCNSDDDEKEIIEFIKSNKALTMLHKDDDGIYIGVNCFLNDFNEDIFEEYVVRQKSMSSYIYSQSPYDFEMTKRLFLAIWKERRFNLRVYCEWQLRDDCMVSAIDHCNMGGHKELVEDRIPQPHIDKYTCYSGYRETLSSLAEQRDYIGVLSTIQASSASINWTDSTVVSSLMEDLFNNKKDVKCLEDADGNHYTIAEIVEILQNESK